VNGEGGAKVEFEDGARAMGDILLGCDGIHSFVRTAAVEPDRKPVYSGISNAYGLLDASSLSGRLPFDATGMYSGRKGAFMMSYYDAAKEKLYASAVMETAAPTSREGWKLKVENRKEVKANILSRFGGSPQPLLDELIKATDDWYFYPVYKLAPKGKWHSGACLLLGDAAHAVRSLPTLKMINSDNITDAATRRKRRPRA
jgi:salicylate hydroxylase